MTSTETRNAYLDQVVAQQERLEQDLRSKRAAPPAAAGSAPAAPAPVRGPVAKRQRVLDVVAGAAGGVAQPAGAAVDVRVTGFWRWRTVIVPPNAFVVHTRRGRPAPLHLGLGVSFRFNPA